MFAILQINIIADRSAHCGNHSVQAAEAGIRRNSEHLLTSQRHRSATMRSSIAAELRTKAVKHVRYNTNITGIRQSKLYNNILILIYKTLSV